MTKPANVKKGEQYWCVHRRLALPMQGTCIALTDNVGKQVGIQFEENIGGHSCDGRGEHGKCLWFRPSNLYTDEEYALVRKKLEEMAEHRARIEGKDVEVLG
jgi:hypothetical protein